MTANLLQAGYKDSGGNVRFANTGLGCYSAGLYCVMFSQLDKEIELVFWVYPYLVVGLSD